MYNLPESNIRGIKKSFLKLFKNGKVLGAVSLILAGIILGITLNLAILKYFPSQLQSFLNYIYPQEVSQNEPTTQPAPEEYESGNSYEQAVINAVKRVSPSVVSIVISKNLPVYEEQWVNPFGDSFPGFSFQIPQQVQNGTEYKQVGAGSGFIVSTDGLVLTNKHVVSDDKADYTVFTNDGKKYSAEVLAIDPVQDLAVIKIQSDKNDFQAVTLGDSDGIQIGQTAIAIGNALGQFSNTVSIGVVSGLGRTISASDQTGSFSEKLEDIIQTDAAINEGNSGGPLINLRGEVMGINTAMAQGAQDIGFAIPINVAKRSINQVKTSGEIVYPFLGVRYVVVDGATKEEYKLSVDYGALVLKGENGEPAVTAGSAAEKAGIKDGDVILELNGQKITIKNKLSPALLKFNPGDVVSLKILRNGQEINVDATLGKRS